MEVLCEGPGPGDVTLHNFLVYSSPQHALVIGVCACEGVFARIPWDILLTECRRPRPIGTPADHRTELLNPGEGEKCNPNRYLLWLHSALSYRALHGPLSVAVIDTLLGLRRRLAETGEEPILGAALYELHVLDRFVPRCPRELEATLEEHHRERLVLLQDRERTPDGRLFFLVRGGGGSE